MGAEIKEKSRDFSWGAVAINYIAIAFVAYVTHPIKSDVEGPDAILFLLLKTAALAIAAAIAVGVAALFRRDKELAKKRRSFIIASWVFLGLMVWGATTRSTAQPGQQPQEGAAAVTAPQAVMGADYLRLQLSALTDQQFQEGSAYWLSQHPDYASDEWVNALSEELRQVYSESPVITLGMAMDLSLLRLQKKAAQLDASQPQKLDQNGCPEHYTFVPAENLCYPVVHMTQEQAAEFNARQQAKRDMQEAVEEAIRATR